MDTQHLQAFVAIAEIGSFSGAGERLHLTQPAISKRIALLEEQIKAKLFDRVGRQVVLTQAGNLLLKKRQRFWMKCPQRSGKLQICGATSQENSA